MTKAKAETVAPEAAEGVTKALHKLQWQWAFWFDDQSKRGAAWDTSLRKVYSFDTVEEFWCFSWYQMRCHVKLPFLSLLVCSGFRPSKLKANADFHLFKLGIEPKREGPECANRGKWTVPTSTKSSLETMWLETLMALIGEQFDESEEICGVVACVRQRQDKVNIGKKWKEIIDFNDKMVYSFHDDARREKSNRGGRYSI